jgi:hypothetical protein
MMATPRTEPQPASRARRLDPSLLGVFSSGALMTAAAGVVWGLRTAMSVGCGALIAAANLYVLSKIVARLMGGASDGARGEVAAAFAVLAVAKMVFLFGGVWLLLSRGLVDPIGLIVGYGALPIGIAIRAAVSDKTGDT